MNDDNRYSNPLSIDGPGPRKVIGVMPGGPNAALNAANKALAAAMTQLRTRAGEIRGHSQLLPSERDRRLQDLRHPALEANRLHQRVLAVEARRIKTLAATANFVKPTPMQPGHVQVEDQALAAKFAAMNASERMQVASRAMADPLDPMNLRWAECLLRVHPLISGIDIKMHDQLRSAVLLAHDPLLVESIQTQLDQLEQAERTAALAQQTLSEELPGALQELRAAPELPTPQEPAFDASTLPAEVLADLRNPPRLTVKAPFEAAP